MKESINKKAPFFGQHMTEARTKAGLSQAQLARKMGLPVSKIDHYENRCPNPPMKFILRISTVLNVSLTDLLKEDKK